MKDLDALPLPAYHLLDPSDIVNYRGEESVLYDVSLSRGCPFRCQFCCTSTNWGTSYRSFGVERTVDLIDHLLRTFKTDFVILNDDTFTVNEERVVGICQEILDRGLKFDWYARTRVDLIKRESLEWMKKAGCKIVSYGVESGSPTILKNINKKTKLDQIVKTFEMTKEVGLGTDATIMIGNPGETGPTIEETEMLLEQIRPVSINVGLPILWPGTGLYELAKEQNLIDDEYWLTDLLAPIYTGAMPLPRMWIYKWRMLYRHAVRQKKVVDYINLLRKELSPFRMIALMKILSFSALNKTILKNLKKSMFRSSDRN